MPSGFGVSGGFVRNQPRTRPGGVAGDQRGPADQERERVSVAPALGDEVELLGEHGLVEVAAVEAREVRRPSHAR